MKTPKLLVPALSQYWDSTEYVYVPAFDYEIASQVVIDLSNEIIDLKACLRSCANAANGGLEQYK